MLIVVQNRSAQAVAGLDLTVDINGAAQHYPITWLAGGATTLVNLPISSSQIAAAGRIELRSELVNPAGVADQVTTNNHRSSVLAGPGKK